MGFLPYKDSQIKPFNQLKNGYLSTHPGKENHAAIKAVFPAEKR
jgi:hypothetical protein